MMNAFWPVARAAFFRMDAERAHDLTLALLERLPRRAAPSDDPRLSVQVFGLSFPNPIGISAGFDKNARVPDAMLGLGFGFAEIGTVTPLAQPGNPSPRVVRLPADLGVINRLGFNNDGHGPALARLKARAGRPGIVGANVGANKEAADRTADYAAGIKAFAPHADYLTINISSPNTPGLRDLQTRGALDDLLARALEARDEVAAAGVPRRPVLLKIAPDLALGDLDDVVDVALARGVDGLIISNTTISRPAGLRDPARDEAGGLSGRPLFRLSTWMLAEARLRLAGRIPLVGVGGIDSGASALAKIRAGADLIQIYSGLVYRGPALVPEIKTELVKALAAGGTLADIVGQDAEPVSRQGAGRKTRPARGETFLPNPPIAPPIPPAGILRGALPKTPIGGPGS